MSFLERIASLSGYVFENDPESKLLALTAIAPDLDKGHPEKCFTRTFNFEKRRDRDLARGFISQMNATRNVYFSPAAMKDPANRKPNDLEVRASRFLWADLDPRPDPDADPTEHLRAERDRIQRRLEEATPEPSVIIDSGNGYQALWILSEPVEIHGIKDRVDDFKLYGQALATMLEGDAVGDPSRILRVPGTLNRPDEKKRKRGRVETPARLVKFESELAHPLVTMPKASPPQGSTPRRVTDLGDLKLPDDVRAAIETGDAPIDGRSRSEHVFWVARRLLVAGIPDDVIQGVLMDPGFGISESILEKDTEIARIRQARRAVENARVRLGGKTPVVLPGGSRTNRDFARELGVAASARGVVRRGGAVFTLDDRDLELVNSARAVTVLERAASFFTQKSSEGKTTLAPATINETTTRIVLAADEFAAELPEVRSVSDCPVLHDDGARLVEVTGFDEDLGILTRGEVPETLSIEDAARSLDDVLCDYDFASESDRSRAVAAILTPAINSGRLLGDRARVPMLVVEADDSQAGKGLLCRLIASIYGTTAGVVTQRDKGSVGSTEELMQGHLLRGRSMVLIDNVRGRFGSPMLESALTERSISCRVPYRPDVAIDPSGVAFMMTSNEADLTIDLANRSNFVRIRKRDDAHQYRRWPEGSIEEHVAANQRRFLGAVWAVLREWHSLGKPMADDRDRGHDFAAWGRAVRAIVRDVLGLADPLEGVRSIQREKATPSATWIRKVLHAVKSEGWEGVWWRASELIDLCDDKSIEIPGVQSGDDLGDDDVRGKASQGIGRKLAAAFRKAEGGVVVIDGLRFERREVPRNDGRGALKWYAVGEPVGQPGDLDEALTGEEPF